MSSRIIRGSERIKKPRISGPGTAGAMSGDRSMEVEKQAFEKGYLEGERMGKQMGEQMVGTVVKRYDQSISELAVAHRKLVESMQTEAVQLSLEVARSILGREVTADPDVVTALVGIALKRVEGHQEIVLRLGRDDYERVRKNIEDINSTISVEEAVELDRGDFTIDTSKTHLDGRMETRISQIGRSLLEENPA
jgi:flagellar assembly protein FliH